MNQNSMYYWFPRIEHLDIPMPRTTFCNLNVDEVRAAADRTGYPCFLRTDLCSGKHDWKESCFLQNRESVLSHMGKILNANVRWQLLGIEPQGFVVREFLNLETLFTAFEGDMPINPERRYFVHDGDVYAHILTGRLRPLMMIRRVWQTILNGNQNWRFLIIEMRVKGIYQITRKLWDKNLGVIGP